MNEAKRPRVGVGILLFNEKNQVLLGIRKSKLGFGRWAPPGGHLEFGESFEQCAIRELFEETGISIIEATFVGVTNNVFDDTDTHYVSVFMHAFLPENQQIKNIEPDKIVSWQWFDWGKFPENILLPFETLLQEGTFKHIDSIVFFKKNQIEKSI